MLKCLTSKNTLAYLDKYDHKMFHSMRKSVKTKIEFVQENVLEMLPQLVLKNSNKMHNKVEGLDYKNFPT